MRHRKTYMYVNFQQNRVNSSVILAHKCIREKIASCTKIVINTKGDYEVLVFI